MKLCFNDNNVRTRILKKTFNILKMKNQDLETPDKCYMFIHFQIHATVKQYCMNLYRVLKSNIAEF